MDWEQAIAKALAESLTQDTAPNLAASIRYSILSPGKRFRPRLMDAAAQLLSVAPEQFIPFAIALEWIHGFTLIHDDLPCMDNDDYRRGLPTNHKVYGEALALLAGDALVPAAIEFTFQSLKAGTPPSHWQSALLQLLYNVGPSGVIGGQAREFLLNPQSSLSELREMHHLKTGALFESAILIPAHLKGLDPSSSDFVVLRDFAEVFGMAFQTADDLEDSEREWDPKTGYPHTSILSHLEFEEARSEALSKIQKASHDLQVRWHNNSAPLLSIVAQLEEKLRAARPPSRKSSQ